jgi:large subunit ribosomal protein L21
MYAIIATGGKQYKVQVGDIIEVEKLGIEPGNEVVFEQVLAVAGEDGKLNIGTPVLENAKVTAVVKDLFRAKKIVVFKMKRRKSYRRTHGHRQDLNRIEITAIQA